MEYHNDEKQANSKMSWLMSIQLTSGVHEKRIRKDSEYLYQEPALVPLGKKPKV